MELINKIYSFINPVTSSITIEITSFCNVRCIWCPMQNFKKHKLGYMKLEQFNNIINRNKNYLKENNIGVEPYFRGEPLLHPNFWEICDILKRNEIINNGINTNLSLEIDHEKFLEYKMGILVNIGGITKEVHEKVMTGSNFELVVNNLKKLWQLKIPAKVKMNPTKINFHQLKDMPGFVKNLGGKEKYIFPYTTCYPIPATATQEEIEFFFEKIVSEEVNPYLRFTYDLLKPDKEIKTKTPGCHFLQDIIFFDGQYSICCHDQLQMINLGNALEIPIENIRTSKEYANAITTAKKCGFPFCKECN